MGRDQQQMAAWRIGQRVNFVSAADSQGAPSKQEKRNVRAEAGSDLQEAGSLDALPGQLQETYQRRRGIARSAAEAAAHRNALGEHGAHAVFQSDFGPKVPDGAIDQVVLAGLSCKLRISGNAQIDAEFSPGFQHESVMQGDSLEDRPQFVVT